MGGSLFVGIRHTMNGKPEEVLIERWTNDFPWRHMQPGFLTQGDELRGFIEEAKPTNQWPESIKVDEVFCSEYGLVLIDLPAKSMLSRNDYCTAGSFYVTGHSTAIAEEAKAALDLEKMGWLGDCEYWGLHGGPVMKPFKEFLKEMGKGFPNGFWRIFLSRKVFRVDDAIDRRPPRSVVLNWMRKHGWKSPVRRKWRRE